MGKFNISNLDLYYTDFHALKNVNLDLPEKEITAFIGPSGCGKSTLVSLISRFYDVTCGTVKLNGRNVKELSNQEIHDKVGIVQQRSVLFKGDRKSVV